MGKRVEVRNHYVRADSDALRVDCLYLRRSQSEIAGGNRVRTYQSLYRSAGAYRRVGARVSNYAIAQSVARHDPDNTLRFALTGPFVGHETETPLLDDRRA